MEESTKARCWCYTLNNYTDEDVKITREIDCRYNVFGYEIGESGTKHLQGYIEFTKPMHFKTLKKILKKCHWEKKHGPREKAREYCMKDGNFEEIGDWNSGGQGKRNDLTEHLKNYINMNKLDFIEKYPNIYHKYNRMLHEYKELTEEKNAKMEIINQMKDAKLNEIQQEIMYRLEMQTDRQITWVCDYKGNSGKSWLAQYLVVNSGAAYFTNAKTTDIAHAYNKEELIVFDFTRSLEGKVNYGVLEALKNGMIFSSKYNSKLKIFKKPKIIVMANFNADLDKLSEDRWDLMEVNGYVRTEKVKKEQEELYKVKNWRYYKD